MVDLSGDLHRKFQPQGQLAMSRSERLPDYPSEQIASGAKTLAQQRVQPWVSQAQKHTVCRTEQRSACKVSIDDETIDFYPSTGLYILKDGTRGRGIFNLWKLVKDKL